MIYRTYILCTHTATIRMWVNSARHNHDSTKYRFICGCLRARVCVCVTENLSTLYTRSIFPCVCVMCMCVRPMCCYSASALGGKSSHSHSRARMCHELRVIHPNSQSPTHFSYAIISIRTLRSLYTIWWIGYTHIQNIYTSTTLARSLTHTHVCA